MLMAQFLLGATQFLPDYGESLSVEETIKLLENASENLFKWFLDNQMKTNPEKCHLILNTKEMHSLNLVGSSIENEESLNYTH